MLCSPGQAELSILLSTKHIAQHKAHDKLIDPSETSNHHLHTTRYKFGVKCPQQYTFDYSHLCFLKANVICLFIRRGIWNWNGLTSISSSSKWPSINRHMKRVHYSWLLFSFWTIHLWLEQISFIPALQHLHDLKIFSLYIKENEKNHQSLYGYRRSVWNIFLNF